MKNNKTVIQKETTVFPWFGWLIVLMAAFTALCFYKPHSSGYSVFTRSWGFDHLLFYNSQVQILLYALALTLIVPYTNGLITNYINTAAFKISGLRKKRTFLFIAISIASIVLFYFFRVKYFFLGDINLRLIQVIQKEFLSTEYLTMRILYYVSAFGMRHGFTAYQTFACYSCFAGGVFVFFCLNIANLLGKDHLQKLFFFFAQVSSALLLVFCGYIEIYATPVVFLIMYVYFALRYLQFNTGFYLVIISFVLAAFSHLLSFIALPSVAVVWYMNHKSSFGFITAMSAKKTAGIIFVMAILALALALRSDTGLILPLLHPNRDYMTLLSFTHLWEFINGELLACGLSFIFLPVLVWKVIRKKTQLNTSTWFLLCFSGSFLFAIALLNLHRGSCDWDLMALPAITLNLLTAILITVVYAQNTTVKHYLLLTVIGLNTVQTSLWIGINHTDRSIVKIDKMLATDPATYYTKLPPLLQLGLIYEANSLLNEAEKAGERACNDHHMNDIRSCMFYAKKLIVNKKPELAIPVIEDVLNVSPFSIEAYFYLLQYFQDSQQTEPFLNTLNKLFAAFQLQTEFFLQSTTYKSKSYSEAFAILLDSEMQRKVQDTKKIKAIQNTLELLKTKP